MEQPADYLRIGHDIIGSSFNVRNEAGRGLREIFYKKALAWELQQKGHDVQIEVTVLAVYKCNIIEDAYKADIVVDGRVIIETKAVGRMGEAEVRHLLTYLKLSGFKLGYLINFGAWNFTTGRMSDPFPYDKGIYRFVNKI